MKDGPAAADPASTHAALELRSSDGRIVVTVNPAGALTYRVSVDGDPILDDSRLGLRLHDGVVLGRDVTLVKAERAEAGPASRLAADSRLLP